MAVLRQVHPIAVAEIELVHRETIVEAMRIVRLADDGWFVDELGTAPIQINQQVIRGRVPLRDGDFVHAGASIYRFDARSVAPGRSPRDDGDDEPPSGVPAQVFAVVPRGAA
jgi:hypothetical protein